MPYERFNKPANATLIEELDTPSPMTEKFIRTSHSVPIESGMVSNKQQEYEEYTPPPFLPMQQQYIQPTQPSRPLYEPIVPQRECMCPEVYMHIMNCPVCKKIYGQNSSTNTVYIVIIIMLLIFCILLFRKAFP